MTRDEAVHALLPACANSFVQARKFVDAFLALGLLNLETPKTDEDAAYEAMVCAIGHIEAGLALERLRSSGFKIVRDADRRLPSQDQTEGGR